MANKFVYDKEPEKKPGEGKNIILSVFFDGTQNNKTNTESPLWGKVKRLSFMDSDVRQYSEFLNPLPEPEEVEIPRAKDEVTFEIKGQSELEEVQVYGFARKGDSYENDYTNVARLSEAYVRKTGIQDSIYIEGAGTEDNMPDDKAAVATGAFFSSIRVKARKACEKITDKLKLYSDAHKDQYIDTLTIDVFGFSRGAATARYFTHFITCKDTKPEISKYFENHATPKELTDVFEKSKKSCKKHFAFMDDEKLSFIEKTEAIPEATRKVTNELISSLPKVVGIIQQAYTDETHEYFQQQLKKDKVLVKNIVIRFVGLYDSVSSYGLFFDNDVDDLGLAAINKAKQVVHLSAADEYRKNFALTNIISTGFKGIALSLPGVHSDVGGSYNKVEYEKTAFYIMALSIPRKLATTLAHNTNKFLENLAEPGDITNFKRKLIKEGWLKPEQCKSEYTWWLSDHMQSAILTGVLQNVLEKISRNPLAPDIIEEINEKLLKDAAIGMPPFGVLYGHRLLYQGYSFIPLYLMADFALEMGVPIKKSILNNKDWVVPSDLKTIESGVIAYKDKVVNLRKGLYQEDQKEKLEKRQRDGVYEQTVGAIGDVFTADKQKKYLKQSGKISYLDFIKEKDLHFLRNKYLHWSSKSDKFGLDPNSRSINYEGKRKIYEG